jgi:hypothetical protein
MSVCCECRVLSGRGLCDGLITRPDESYRVWCVWVWSWSLGNEEALAPLGAVVPWRKNSTWNVPWTLPAHVPYDAMWPEHFTLATTSADLHNDLSGSSASCRGLLDATRRSERLLLRSWPKHRLFCLYFQFFSRRTRKRFSDNRKTVLLIKHSNHRQKTVK